MKFIRRSKECFNCKLPWTKPGAKGDEPIEMVERSRDNAGDKDTNIRTPTSQFDAPQVSGDEQESRDSVPLEGAGGGVGIEVADVQETILEKFLRQNGVFEEDENEEENEGQEENEDGEENENEGEGNAVIYHILCFSSSYIL
jgi:hypothetical protein